MVYKFKPLLPACCVLCGAALRGELDLCAPCAAELPLHEDGCPLCAMPLGSAHLAPCGHCQRQPPRFSACVAALRYEYPARELIARFKFHGDLAAGRVLAHLLARRIAASDPGHYAGTVLVPVPLHRTRLAERGFNQSERIARVLARELALPMLPALAARVRRTEDQKSLDAGARRRNLATAFHAEPCAGLRVAIIDDVITTGTTADALAATLLEAGAARVEAWCLARAL